VKENAKYLVFLFPIVGIVMSTVGLLWRNRLKAQTEGFIRIAGTVTGSSVGGSEGNTAVVEYVVDGQSFSITGNLERHPAKKVGSQLTVIYSPRDPSSAFIVEDYFFAANIVLGIGGVWLLLGSLIAYHLVLDR
jgi:hypothetical protein